MIPALALLAASLAPACRSSVGSWEEDLPRADAPSSLSQLAEPVARWVEAEPREEARAWPAVKGIVLALTRWGSTELIALDPVTGVNVSLAHKISGEPETSQAENRLAILIPSGVNPARNTLEIWDLRRGERSVLEPADGYAFIGFTLAPSGATVVYTEINLRRSNSRRVLWRTALADRSQRQVRVLVTSDASSMPAGVVPVPLAWSEATREIYLQGLQPFRGMASAGIWSMTADGSVTRLVLPESAYTAAPRLSPDGRFLAYLATRVEGLPRGYLRSPGAPPPNVLVVMDAARGESISSAEQAEAAYGAFAWAGGAAEILASRREWREGRLRDVAFLRASIDTSLTLSRNGAAPASRVTQVGRCGSGPFFWVEEDSEAAKLRAHDVNDAKEYEWMTLPAGKIRVVGCLGERD